VGLPEVERVLAAAGHGVEGVLRLAGAVEQDSGHLLARTVVKEVERRGLTLPQASVDTAVVSLRMVTRLTVGLVFVQLILGALMRHTGAGLAIPDFPLALGRVIPPLLSQGVLIHFLHRLGALLVAIAVVWTVARVLNAFGHETQLRRPALGLLALLVLQLTLGALTIWTQRAVTPMTAHVAVGAAVLATSVMLALRTTRLVGPRISKAQTQTLISEQVTA
jgi:heme A synthase